MFSTRGLRLSVRQDLASDWWTRWGFAAAGLCATCAVGFSVPAVANAATESFTTAGCSTWNVPAGVTSLQVSAVGAAGASSSGSGGAGDGEAATMSVTPTQVLDVCVDVDGGSGGPAGSMIGGGGGAGGAGGGLSGVAAGTTFANPLLVAGGGGGGAGAGMGGDAGGAGGAGGLAGSQGAPSASTSPGEGGEPGTSRAPGAGGAGGTDASNAGGDGSQGDAGSGMDGGEGGAGGTILGGAGGGGGGGYYGGGGGGGGEISNNGFGGGGGGGGSDFCANGAPVSDCTLSIGAGTQPSAGSATGDAQITLTYTAAFALTVEKRGTGAGKVSSSPAGITCGAACTDSFRSGTAVTLSAKATFGSRFAGWSGACAGSTGCEVRMNETKSVGATFNKISAPNTRITGTNITRARKKATFDFTGTGGAGALRFQCKLDAGAWKSCTSPHSYAGLSDGNHTFEVRAIDARGEPDPTPAEHMFKI